ncbi:MAG: hypothetical protein M1480_07125 [Bacteroidetes bacterium]|nr:hypothetical protein [Bacteroidota bacterium]
MENRISIVFATAVQTSVKDAINALITNLSPVLINLTKEQRKALSKMAEGSLPFAIDALNYAETEPKFVPASVNVPEFRIDLEAYTVLSEFFTLLKPIMTGIEDTKTLCGAETFKSSRSVYKIIKQAEAEGVPGAKDAAEKLGKRFKGQGGSGNSGGSTDTPTA